MSLIPLALVFSAVTGTALFGEPAPTSISGVRGVLWASSFEVDRAFPYDFAAEHPQINGGTLLVLDADPALLLPRQVQVPVLFAGSVPADLTNTGYPSGHVVVFVPSSVDVRNVPFYFGSTELPERIDARRGLAEQASALSAGAHPFSATAWDAAFAAGNGDLHFATMNELYRKAADLIDLWAPSEAEQASRYRVSRVPE
jgi:hypothetical protein